MGESRILPSHVGSLVRPLEFAALLRERASGREVADFDAALRNAVETVVRRQVQCGVDIVSDGEFGKGIGWEQYVIERLSGFSEPPATPSGAPPPAAPAWGDGSSAWPSCLA
jgi:5-methyltetrahydropteroyltriglutamate--homocysteine methyltransferase